MKQFDINEVKDYIRQSSPESKIYLGADSERTRLDKVWWADYTVAIVVHMTANTVARYLAIMFVNATMIKNVIDLVLD